MNASCIVLIILGIIFVLILIFGLPRKKSIRRPNIEGLDNPEVAKAFEKMTNFAEIPPRVEYTLTQDGMEVRDAMIPLMEWAHKKSIQLKAEK